MKREISFLLLCVLGLANMGFNIFTNWNLKGQNCSVEITGKRKISPLAHNCLQLHNNIHQEYNQLGFDDYIAKPFDLDLFYRIIRKQNPQPMIKPD